MIDRIYRRELPVHREKFQATSMYRNTVCTVSCSATCIRRISFLTLLDVNPRQSVSELRKHKYTVQMHACVFFVEQTFPAIHCNLNRLQPAMNETDCSGKRVLQSRLLLCERLQCILLSIQISSAPSWSARKGSLAQELQFDCNPLSQ